MTLYEEAFISIDKMNDENVRLDRELKLAKQKIKILEKQVKEQEESLIRAHTDNMRLRDRINWYV